jgi:hypothetical protein
MTPDPYPTPWTFTARPFRGGYYTYMILDATDTGFLMLPLDGPEIVQRIVDAANQRADLLALVERLIEYPDGSQDQVAKGVQPIRDYLNKIGRTP